MQKRIKTELIINITDKDIEHIITEAEEGIKHWCDKIEPVEPQLGTSPYEHLIHGGTLVLHKIGSSGYENTQCITGDKIVNGIKKYIEEPTEGDFLEIVDHELHIDINYIDENIADAIIQYALFDKVIYKQGIRL